MKKHFKIFLSLAIFTSVFVSVSGQNSPEVPMTLASPYNTMYNHLYYLQPDSYDPALAAQTIYLEDSTRAEKAAIKLKQILDGKGLYVRLNKIPKDENYVDTTTQQAVFTPFPRELPEVYLEKIDDNWYYSPETVDRIPALHRSVYPFGSDLLVNLFPKFGNNRILGLAVWQYFGLLTMLLLGTLVFLFFRTILNPLVARLSRSRLYPKLISPERIRKITRLLSVFLVVRMIKVLLPSLQLPIEAAEFAVMVIRILSTILVVLILLQILEIVMAYVGTVTRKTESRLDEQLMPILRATFQVFIIIGGCIQLFQVLDINITTLIAGLSIGGLAIALAAQDTVKNLFGSLTIFMDRPFQIGDWINFSGVDGTVEEVGFRSTRVRTFANSLVYVPNGKLSDMTIDNFGLRRYRRFSTKIAITYNTPPILIEKFIEGLRALVVNHPLTRKDYYEIHLNDMNASSIDILFYIFFEVPSWSDELKGRHEILMAIISLAARLGVSFAFPSTSLYVEKLAKENGSNRNPDPKEADQAMHEFLRNYKEELSK